MALDELFFTLGPLNTFSDRHVRNRYNPDANMIRYANTIPAVFSLFEQSLADKTAVPTLIVPIENTDRGDVSQTLELILDIHQRHNVVITNGLVDEIKLAIGGIPSSMEDVQTILTKPEAAGQCKRYLSGFPKAKVDPRDVTTAKAIELLVNEASNYQHSAAIAHPDAFIGTGLTIYANNVSDLGRNNRTLFLKLQKYNPRRRQSLTGHSKALIAVTDLYRHLGGNNMRVDQVFQESNLSWGVPFMRTTGKNTSTTFYDVRGDPNEPEKLNLLLERLNREFKGSHNVYNLGVFPCQELFPRQIKRMTVLAKNNTNMLILLRSFLGSELEIIGEDKQAEDAASQASLTRGSDVIYFGHHYQNRRYGDIKAAAPGIFSHALVLFDERKLDGMDEKYRRLIHEGKYDAILPIVNRLRKVSDSPDQKLTGLEAYVQRRMKYVKGDNSFDIAQNIAAEDTASLELAGIRFLGDREDIHSYNVVVTPYGPVENWSKLNEFLGLIRRAGARTNIVAPERHDKILGTHRSLGLAFTYVYHRVREELGLSQAEMYAAAGPSHASLLNAFDYFANQPSTKVIADFLDCADKTKILEHMVESAVVLYLRTIHTKRGERVTKDFDRLVHGKGTGFPPVVISGLGKLTEGATVRADDDVDRIVTPLTYAIFDLYQKHFSAKK